VAVVVGHDFDRVREADSIGIVAHGEMKRVAENNDAPAGSRFRRSITVLPSRAAGFIPAGSKAEGIRFVLENSAIDEPWDGILLASVAGVGLLLDQA
jgi:hypothetical protein